MILDYVIKPEPKRRGRQHGMSSRLLDVSDWEKVASDAAYEPKTMACHCSVSLLELERFFKLRIGQSPAAWIRHLRCQRAVKLILAGYSSKAAAEELGFASPADFCHEFKRVYGVLPLAFAPVRTRRANRAVVLKPRSQNKTRKPKVFTENFNIQGVGVSVLPHNVY
jgi:AraC-like DNA-binding protein